MAFDVLSKKQGNRNWARIGSASDLPGGYKVALPTNPDNWWSPEKMEKKLAEIMSKPKSVFGYGPKPTRAEAIPMLDAFMKSKGIRAMSSSSSGSVLFSAKEQAKLMNKMDDVRYDMRSTRNIIGASVFALAGGLAFVGIASVFRTSKGR